MTFYGNPAFTMPYLEPPTCRCGCSKRKGKAKDETSIPDHGVPRILSPRRGEGRQYSPLANFQTLSPYGTPAIPHSLFMQSASPLGQSTLTLTGPSREDGAPLWMPGTFPPVPYGIAVPIQLHPLLIVNPNNPNCPTLQWDVAQRPDTAIEFTGRELFRKPDLDEEATAQVTHRIMIYSEVPALSSWMRLWGGIEAKNGKKLTIYHVLEAVHQYLQAPLTRKEYKKAVKLDPSNAHRFHEAAYWRIMSSCQIQSVEHAQGLKRVDVLGDYRYFRGFKPVWHGGVWAVMLELGAKGVSQRF